MASFETKSSVVATNRFKLNLPIRTGVTDRLMVYPINTYWGIQYVNNDIDQYIPVLDITIVAYILEITIC